MNDRRPHLRKNSRSPDAGANFVIRLCASLKASSLAGRLAVLGFMANIAGNVVPTRLVGLAGITLSTAIVEAVSLARRLHG
jgi:hypothetical protein